jgi:O-antigen/teichoic acid export membrane protein
LLNRLLKGVGANALGHIVVIFLQLSQVPVFVSHWGLGLYGVWILLFAIPSYFVLSDFGFATAASAKMTMKVAVGDRDGALMTFQSAWAAIVGCSVFFIIGTWVACCSLPSDIFIVPASISATEVRFTAAILATYGIVILQGSIFTAGFTCSGKYAIAHSLNAFVMLSEGSGAMCAVILGGSLWIAALAFLMIRMLGCLTMAFVLSQNVSWITFGFGKANITEIKILAHSGISMLSIPISQALVIQGITIVIGYALSNVDVAVFATTRTITRIIIQLSGMITRALIPEFSSSFAMADTNAGMKIFFMTISSSLSIVLLVSPIILLYGQSLMTVWTRSAIVPPKNLIVMLTIAAVINCCWFPVSNLILSINKQASYSYFYMAASILCVIISYPLSAKMGVSGAAYALILLEIIMGIYICKVAPRLILYPQRRYG